jgi:hypothetical protein
LDIVFEGFDIWNYIIGKYVVCEMESVKEQDSSIPGDNPEGITCFCDES